MANKITDELISAREQFRAEAFRAGAEAMREAAAKACEGRAVAWTKGSMPVNRHRLRVPMQDEFNLFANDIRALPLLTPPGYIFTDGTQLIS